MTAPLVDKKIEGVVLNLPSASREVVESYSRGLSFTDIAKEKGVSRQAVDISSRKAREEIYQVIKDHPDMGRMLKKIEKGGVAILDAQKISGEYGRFTLSSIRGHWIFGSHYVHGGRFLILFGKNADQGIVKSIRDLCVGEVKGMPRAAKMFGLPLRLNIPYFGEASCSGCTTAIAAGVESGDMGAGVSNNALRCIPYHALSATIAAYRNNESPKSIYEILSASKYCSTLLKREGVVSIKTFMRYVASNSLLREQVLLVKHGENKGLYEWREHST